MGTAEGETLAGTESSDELYGLDGDDRLEGGEGDDLLDGGSGADLMIGGAGDDVYIVDNWSDQVVEEEDGGVDEVRALGSFHNLAANMERLVGIGTDQTLVGNTLDNEIWAGAGRNSLQGWHGDDVLHLTGAGGSAHGGDGYDIVTLPGSPSDYVITREGYVNHGDIRVRVVNSLTGEATVIQTVELFRFGNGAEMDLTSHFDRHGTAGNDTLHGDNSMNLLFGHDGDDILYGYGGSDWLDGGAGADRMTGGGGEDVYIIDNAGDTVVEVAGGGYDHLRIYLTHYVLPAHADFGWAYLTQATTLIGGSTANTLTGNAGDDWLEGRGGDDNLDGRAGADTMIGGTGNDTYSVEDPADVVIEAPGQGLDTVYITLSAYTLPADVETLVYFGSASAVTFIGNSAANRFTVPGNSAVTVDGGAGNDTIDYRNERQGLLVDLMTGETGGAAADDLVTSIENIVGGQAADELRGTDGPNVLDGLWGGDTMIGRGGNDVYLIDHWDDVAVEEEGGGTDEIRIVSWIDEYAMPAHVEKMRNDDPNEFIGWGNDLNNEITGNIDKDTFYGGGGHDMLSGGAGNDILYGEGGHDMLSGGTGADHMEGGEGNDVFLVDNAGDVVIEYAGEGSDHIYTSLAVYTLPDEVENLAYNGYGAFQGTGNGLANVINGGSGGDTLLGFDGDDTLSGGSGNDLLVGGGGDDLLSGEWGRDVLIGGAGADTFRFGGWSTGTGTEADRIEDFVSGEDKIDLSGMDADMWTQGDQAFVFIGGAAFSGTAGELRYGFEGTDTRIQGDLDGDGVADFDIMLTGSPIPLASDFFL
jgi:Ca2+-binding RTX toxin-like protein